VLVGAPTQYVAASRRAIDATDRRLRQSGPMGRGGFTSRAKRTRGRRTWHVHASVLASRSANGAWRRRRWAVRRPVTVASGVSALNRRRSGVISKASFHRPARCPWRYPRRSRRSPHSVGGSTNGGTAAIQAKHGRSVKTDASQHNLCLVKSLRQDLRSRNRHQTDSSFASQSLLQQPTIRAVTPQRQRSHRTSLQELRSRPRSR